MKKILMAGLFIIIAAVGLFFTACGYTKRDVVVTASYSGIEKGYLSLTVGQEASVEFTVTKLPNNASARLIFSKNSNSISTPVLQSFDEKTGKSVITFTALAKGEEIYLRAVADGGNFCEINIKISLPITDFTLKSNVNLFAVRGTINPQALQLNSSLFNFYPSDTSQKDLIFKDSNGNEITQIDANDYPNDQISVRAFSPHISKFNDLTITLINEIGEVNAHEKAESQNIELTSKEQVTAQSPETKIIFITNRSELSRKTIRLVVENNINSLLRVNRSVISQTYLQCSDFDTSKTYTENASTIFEFELQSLQVGLTTIKFDVFYLGYEDYKITRTFDVIIESAPDQVKMNDISQDDNVAQILFDGAYSTVYSVQYLSVIPTTAIYDRIEVSYDLQSITTAENSNPVMSDYVMLTVGGEPIGEVITNLSSPIVAKGVQTTNNEVIYLVIRVFWGEQYGIEHNEDYIEYKLGFEVKTGASALQNYYDDPSGIYFENNGTEQIFKGLYVANVLSYTDNLLIYPISQGAGLYAKVEPVLEQPEVNGVRIIPLKITPLSAGTGKWRVFLANGVYRDLTINVISKVNSLKLDFNEYNSSLTSTRVYDENNSLTSLGVKLSKSGSNYVADVQLKFVVNPINYNLLNTTQSTFTAKSLNGAITFNNSSNILSITTDINGFSKDAFEYKLIVKKVYDFRLISIEDLETGSEEYIDFEANNVFSGTLKIEAYVPLTKVSFTKNEVSLYSLQQLGLNYKEKARDIVDLVYSPNELTSVFDNIVPANQNGKIKISLSSSKSYTLEGNKINITSFGSYDFETGIVEVNVTASTYETFYIYASVTYFGEIYTATLKVVPKFYQTVNEVYLSNYFPIDLETKLPIIYLSPTHSYQDIFTYVSPENAVDKDLNYTFEPDVGYSGSLVRIETVFNNGVRVVYNNQYANIANGGIGTLYISPLASIFEKSGYPDNSLKIRIKIPNGSPENPFVISTAEELLNIGTSGYDKHYILTNIIDLSNVNFTTLGEFSGTIDGLGIGKIIGLNITKQIENPQSNTSYAGLFTRIVNGGKIKNLVIEGTINLTAEKIGSIGLVAGEIEQGAFLENVTVILKQSLINIKTSASLNIGGVVGVNRGTINNYIGVNPDSNEKYVNYPSIVMSGKFNISYGLTDDQTQSYLGGIAGVNEGEGIIKRTTVSNVKVYNNDNYAAVVNMSVEGTKSPETSSSEKLKFSIGAFVGKNVATITASRGNENESLDSVNYYDYIKASGIIEIFQANNKLGGLVGENLGGIDLSVVLENAVSRVKLKSLGTGQQHAFLGGLFAYNNKASVKNCLVQALEDGVSLGTAASMIYSESFGLTTEENPTLNGRVNIFGYDTDDQGVQNNSTFSINNNLKCQTYVGVELQNGEVLPVGKREKVNKTEFATFNNYYGDFLVVNRGFVFDRVDTTLIGDPTKTVNRMQSSQNSAYMAYLFLFKALNQNDQNVLASIDDYNNNYDFPFDFNGEINLYSYDSSILSIGIDGTLTVHQTGLVKIKVLSSLNAKINQDVYIYVIKAANNFSLYTQNISPENEITAGDVVNVFSGKTVSLIAKFYYDSVKIGGKNIEFEPADGFVLINNPKFEGEGEEGEDGEGQEDQEIPTVGLIQIGSLYGLEAINHKGYTSFKIYANIQLNYGGQTYVSKQYLSSSQGTKIYHIFSADHISGATSIATNFEQISVEPSDVFTFNVLTQTDYFAQQVAISQSRLIGANITAGTYFNVQETNRIYTIKMSNEFPQGVPDDRVKLIIKQKNLADNTIVESQPITLSFDKERNFIIIDEDEFALFALDMSTYFEIIPSNNYTYEFEIEEMLAETVLNSYIELVSMQNFFVASFTSHASANYDGIYYINTSSVVTDEPLPVLTSTITVDMNKQSIGEITIESFAGSSQDDINAGREQSNYIDPQAKNPNHMRISVFPSYSDYDYITINNETTQVTSLFTLIDASGQNKSGAVLIQNGIKILKSDIMNNYLYVKYACGSSGVVNGQVLTYSVKAYKNGQVIYVGYKYITVKFTKDVTFEIVGRKVNDESTTIYLTRGSTYNFTITSNGYLENEIYMSTTRPDAITIDKSARTIQIKTDFTYQNVTKAEISIQGRKVVNGENISSAIYTLYEIIIVDYYILPSNGFKMVNNDRTVTIPTDTYTPIKNGSNGIVSVGLGNSYTLQTEFLNGLTVEYTASVSGIVASLTSFQNTLNTQGAWEYQIGSMNSEGNYTYSTTWKRITGSVSKTLTNDNFTITQTASGYLFTPLKVTNVSNPAYLFRFTFGYDYLNGLAYMNENQNKNSFEFVFNVYQLSSIDTPTPVRTAEEFSAMNAGAYYILMNDITLPSTFTPITNAIAGFDGNNKKVIISNNLSSDGTLSRVGIFSVIQTGALVRNLTISVQTTTRYTINQTSASSIYFGLLAGENRGIITNVNVNTVSGVTFRVNFATDIVNTTNYVAALVGLNSGYITNSRVVTNLTSAANVAGFVCYNTGKISSSYVDKSLIINTSSELQNKTAGFVIYNGVASSNGGKITSSYISGIHTGTINVLVYASDTSSVIRSSTEAAGFIFENNGEVTNCYSDIPIQTSSKSAGFVFLNKGTIATSYSSSQLKSNSQESYGFVYDNSTGTLKNTYYLKDNDVNYSINTNYDNLDASQLKYLSKIKFTDPANFFENFLFTNSTEFTKGIWFRPLTSVENQFNNQGKIFTLGKPELIAPNLIARSEFVIDIERTIKDEVTGEITYYYNNTSPYAQGNIYNPYIISTALEFENTIKNSSSGTLNTNNFRIIADIDYQELVITSSKLFNTVIIGDIEGNGMEIRGYIIDSSSSISSGGLFSKIGNGSSSLGSVKNLTLKPKHINMPNTTVVGGLAGTLDSGILFNISVDGFEYSNNGIVILGRNVVGGVIGRAMGSYVMTNITSSISTNATYRSPFVLGEMSGENKITSYFLFRSHMVNTLNKLSYAGSVVAVAAGKGQITNVTVSGLIASMAEFASLVFGGVGDGVVINKVSLFVIQGQFVQAAVYGGLVAGEFYGILSGANVTATNEVTDLFRIVPFKPYAVGGLVGLMGSSSNLRTSAEGKLGGRIESSNVKVSIKSTQIEIVGGLVGELIGGRNLAGVTGVNEDDFVTSIKNSTFTGSLQSEMIVGGIVGRVAYHQTASIAYGLTTLSQGFASPNEILAGADKGFTLVNNAVVSGGTLSVVNENNGNASVGGIVGTILLNTNIAVSLKVIGATSSNKVKIASDIYGSSFMVYAGGLVGGLDTIGQQTTENFPRLTVENSDFDSSIVLSLREMKKLPEDSIISYGKIVANRSSNFIVSGTGLTYRNNGTPIYTGSISENSQSDYFLLQYYDNGTMKQYGNGSLFTPNILAGETAKS